MDSNIEASRQLHKKFGELCGRARGDAVQKKDPKTFLPPVCGGSARIRSVNVATHLTGTAIVYTYKVTWIEEKEKEKEDNQKNKKKSAKQKEMSSEEEESVRPIVKKVSSIMKIPGKVRCDGPCGLVVDIPSTIQFGCDHIICEKCRKTAQSAALFDGSPGCCNANCVKNAKEDGCKVCAGLTDSSQSVCSQPCAAESLFIHVCILKNCGRDVLRTQLDFELASSSRVSALSAALSHYKDLISDSRFYYSLVKPKSRAELEPISLHDTNLRFYDIAKGTSPDIYFIICGQGIRFL
ncbi:unnamed protein product [Caenorhabditis sp. 36 PRJEB53466]|nr:unnamed protein product [Caenorhabditis sp. 36 PRJEB53466]